MSRLTTISIFNLKSNRFWAFKQMAISRGILKELNGLNFYKILGTEGERVLVCGQISQHMLYCVFGRVRNI